MAEKGEMNLTVEWYNQQITQTIILAIVGIAGGLVTLQIYLHQKKSEKRNAAVIVVSQIKDIMFRIEKVRKCIDSNNIINETGFYEFSGLFVKNRWEDNKHLIINDLGHEKSGIIDAFYDAADRIQRQASQFQQFAISGLFRQCQAMGQIEEQLVTAFFLDGIRENMSAASKRDVGANTAEGSNDKKQKNSASNNHLYNAFDVKQIEQLENNITNIIRSYDKSINRCVLETKIASYHVILRNSLQSGLVEYDGNKLLSQAVERLMQIAKMQ